MSTRRQPFGESWRAWAGLAVGVLAVSAHSASSVNLSVLMKTILGEFGWSRSEWAAATTVRLIALVLAMPLVGRATDRWGARTMLGFGAGVVGLALGGMALMHSWTTLMAVSVVMGPAQACVGSVAASALVLRLFRRHRALAIGMLNGGDNVLNAGVPHASARVLDAFGWRLAVAGMAGVYLLLALLIRGVLAESDGRAARHPERRATAPLPWRDPRWWAIVATYVAIYAWVTSLQLHFHAYQTDLGRSPLLAADLLSTQILVGALGAPLFGLVAERTSARFALVLATAGLAAGAGTLWNIEAPWALRAWAIGYGLANSGAVALLALVLEECFGAARIGSLLGGAMFFCMGSTLLANQWTAGVFDYYGSYRVAWQTYTVLMTLTLVPVAWLWRRGAPALAPQP
ncbi:MAG TPA: MFS transporter [Candidatus Limnocylindria bacterium]|nr:MFS transporter [Candidatus Limnocylindria bacterium]